MNIGEIETTVKTVREIEEKHIGGTVKDILMQSESDVTVHRKERGGMMPGYYVYKMMVNGRNLWFWDDCHNIGLKHGNREDWEQVTLGPPEVKISKHWLGDCCSVLINTFGKFDYFKNYLKEAKETGDCEYWNAEAVFRLRVSSVVRESGFNCLDEFEEELKESAKNVLNENRGVGREWCRGYAEIVRDGAFINVLISATGGLDI